MTAPISFLLLIAAAYLLGSIPFGYLAGRARGMDIRQHGSGNIGATNVFRILGRGPGIAVFVLDALKGFLAVRLATWIPGADGLLGVGGAAVIAALAAVLGHNYTCWLGFKGGKGIATSAGVLLGLAPLATGIVLGLWILLFVMSRYVSVASIGAAAGLPVAVIALGWAAGRIDPWLAGFSLLAAVLAIWRHRTNIARLRAGTEVRFERKKSHE